MTDIFAAAHDGKMEWLLVEGVASDRVGSQSVSNDWNSFASTMAASLVANILCDPYVFQGWPRCNQGQCYCWKSPLAELNFLLNILLFVESNAKRQIAPIDEKPLQFRTIVLKVVSGRKPEKHLGFDGHSINSILNGNQDW